MISETRSKRRRILVFLAGLTGFAAATRLIPLGFDRLSDEFEFEPHPQVAGYRRLAEGKVSAPFDPFIGLASDDQDSPQHQITDIEAELFHADRGKGELPVAYFTDLYCPYCRVLDADLREVKETLPINISWHELPVFGEASRLAAQAFIAAARQDARDAFYASLAATPVQVTRPFLKARAERLGLDVAQWTADFSSPATLSELARARALASEFGFFGTPGLVVGRTVVVGQISKTNLRQLIELELSVL